LARYGGKAIKGLRFVGRVAFVVSVATTISSVEYHLSQGELGAAAVDVVDFFTFGGTSYAADKAQEAGRVISEGANAYSEFRDMQESGFVPPPFREKKTEEQRRQERFEARDRFLNSVGL
jgi:hypothetical protein